MGRDAVKRYESDQEAESLFHKWRQKKQNKPYPEHIFIKYI